MSTNANPTDNGIAENQPPTECIHGNPRCPVQNASADTDEIPCWPCRDAFGQRQPDTGAWEVAL